MKNFFLSLMLLLLVPVVYGQRKAHFGLRAGLTFADLIIDGRGFDTGNRFSSNTRTDYSTDVLVTGHIDGFVEIALPHKFYLEPGISFTVLGTEYNYVKIYNKRHSSVNRDYSYEGDKVLISQLNFPIWLKYNVIAGLRPKIGTYIGYIATIKEKRDGYTYTMKDKYRNSDIDFGVGAGVEYHLPLGLFFDVNCNVGIINLSTRGEVNNIFLQTGVGYKF